MCKCSEQNISFSHLIVGKPHLTRFGMNTIVVFLASSRKLSKCCPRGRLGKVRARLTSFRPFRREQFLFDHPSFPRKHAHFLLLWRRENRSAFVQQRARDGDVDVLDGRNGPAVRITRLARARVCVCLRVS